MVDAWPGTVSLYAQAGSYKEAPDRNVSTFQPDRGTPLESRSTSVSTDQIQFDIFLSYDQWTDLISFYRDTLMDGVLPFTRPHPYDVDGASLTFKFMAAPTWADQGGYVYGIASVSLRRLP
jgi:hypothetical protein